MDRRRWGRRAGAAAAACLLVLPGTPAGSDEAPVGAAVTTAAFPVGPAQVLVATCRGNGRGKERLALRVADDHGATQLLGYAQVVQYGYVDTPTGCYDVPRRIDATGHWLVAMDNPSRHAGAFEHEPDYRTLTEIVLYNLRRHTHRTIYHRKAMTYNDGPPRMIRPRNIAVFTDHGKRHALTIPQGRRTTVPALPPRPARIGRCDYAKPSVVLTDGRRVDLPTSSECASILGWLDPDHLAVSVYHPPEYDLQTLYVLNPANGTAQAVPPSPGYDPRLHRDIFNVSFSAGAVSGGKVFFWVRWIHHPGTARSTVDEDVWVVGPDSAPLRVMHFVGDRRTTTYVTSITPWPLATSAT